MDSQETSPTWPIPTYIREVSFSSSFDAERSITSSLDSGYDSGYEPLIVMEMD